MQRGKKYRQYLYQYQYCDINNPGCACKIVISPKDACHRLPERLRGAFTHDEVLYKSTFTLPKINNMRRNGKSRNKLLFMWRFVGPYVCRSADKYCCGLTNCEREMFIESRLLYTPPDVCPKPSILLLCFYRTSKLTPQIFEEVKQSHILASMFDRGHLVARVSKQSKVSEMCNRFQESQWLTYALLPPQICHAVSFMPSLRKFQ